MIADMSWHQFLTLYERVPDYLSAFSNRLHQVSSDTDTEFVQALTISIGDNTAQRAALESMVLSQVHEASGVSVAPDDPLMESGVDSLAATELRIRCSVSWGQQ